MIEPIDYAKIHSALRFPGDSKHLPEADVSEDVFVTLLMADGESREDAESTAYHCRILCSRVLVRDRLIGIKVTTPSPSGDRFSEDA